VEPRLEDRAALNDAIVAPARAQDDRNWEVINEIFDREVVLDLSGHSGGPPVTVSPQELVHGMRQALAVSTVDRPVATRATVSRSRGVSAASRPG
jgi:SnoaL-like domain